jgi:hypothetical protein
LTGARELVSKAVKAFIESGESVAAGYDLYADLSAAQGKSEVAGYWRGRAEASKSRDVKTLTEGALAAAASGDVPRATGIAEEIVFVDRARPAAAVPADAYVLLARLRRDRGDRAQAADVVKALRARGGAVPEDLTSLLTP